MAEVNIGGDSADRSYRYKRPRLQTKIEGRGNGIKTVIPNMVDISKALHIDPAYPTKFFGIELGAQSKFDAKTERAVVNGAHNAADLEVMLNKFIDIFILCPGCQLPEISLKVRKENIRADCAACGFNDFLETKHRLATYITKDRKDAKKKKDKTDKADKADKAAKGDKAAKKERRSKKTESSAATESSSSARATTSAEDSVTWFTDTSNEAQESRKIEELQSMGATDAGDDIDARIQEITRVNTAEVTPTETMRIFLQHDRDLHEITSELRRLELSRGLDETKKIGVLLNALLDLEQPRTIPKQLQNISKKLLPFAKTRHQQNVLIANVELLAGVEHPALGPRMPLILQALYDSDVLDEETILTWHAAPVESSWAVDPEVAQDLRRRAIPFVDWLKEADDDEDDEEEEEKDE